MRGERVLRSAPRLELLVLEAEGLLEEDALDHVELELAAALQQENNIPGAIGHLRTALELDEENAEAHLLLAIIQHASRNNGALAETYTRVRASDSRGG